MELTTPALLFPAISLLLLAYTNRFLTLAQIIRQLHGATEQSTELVFRQIVGLKRRIVLIKFMQGFGVGSFLLCALSMFAIFLSQTTLGKILFGISLLMLAISLLLSLAEVVISTEALEIVVEDIEKANSETLNLRK
jgi:hypothetical protein